MVGLKLNHVSKSGHRIQCITWVKTIIHPLRETQCWRQTVGGLTGKCFLAFIDPVYALQLRHAIAFSLFYGRLIISIPLYIKGLNIHGMSLYIKKLNEEVIITLTSYEPYGLLQITGNSLFRITSLHCPFARETIGDQRISRMKKSFHAMCWNILENRKSTLDYGRNCQLP